MSPLLPFSSSLPLLPNYHHHYHHSTTLSAQKRGGWGWPWGKCAPPRPGTVRVPTWVSGLEGLGWAAMPPSGRRPPQGSGLIDPCSSGLITEERSPAGVGRGARRLRRGRGGLLGSLARIKYLLCFVWPLGEGRGGLSHRSRAWGEAGRPRGEAGAQAWSPGASYRRLRLRAPPKRPAAPGGTDPPEPLTDLGCGAVGCGEQRPALEWVPGAAAALARAAARGHAQLQPPPPGPHSLPALPGPRGWAPRCESTKPKVEPHKCWVRLRTQAQSPGLIV